MLLRQLVALFSMASALHLTTVGPTTPCAHGADDQSTVAPYASSSGDREGAEHAHEATTAPTQHEETSPQPCEEPSSAQCCPAAIGCAGILATAAATLSRADYLAAIIAPGATTAVITPAAGPEPPPPKSQILTA